MSQPRKFVVEGFPGFVVAFGVCALALAFAFVCVGLMLRALDWMGAAS